MQLPPFGFIRQKFPKHPRPDPRALVRAEFARTGLLEKIKAGDRVCITAGSRGIESMKEVLSASIEAVRERGGEPFLYPAMGSHGGGTARGQVEVLDHLGLTEASLGAPIHAGMDMVAVGEAEGRVTVYADRAAVEAAHVIIVNRVKDHTEYIGETESGLLKMAVVGLGRRLGADSMHKLAVNISYYRSIHAVASVLFAKLPILGGIAILEDHGNQVRRVEAVPAAEVFSREPELLREARQYKPVLPFDRLDVLVCGEIGKDISGAGFDTKVIGRIMNIYEKECETPKITRIVLLDLSEKCGGNAIGIGLADFTTKRAVEKIDFDMMAINSIVSAAPEKGRVPLTLANDRLAVEAGFETIGLWEPENVRALWISDTKNLEWLAATPALLRDAARREDLEVSGAPFGLPFDGAGNLPKIRAIVPR